MTKIDAWQADEREREEITAEAKKKKKKKKGQLVGAL
jgi:hypothetical protein